MIDLILIILLILFFVFHYTNTNTECNTAASTILQIWTGTCGMACRHSGYSHYSGMSGLNQPPLPLQGSAAPRSNCVCEACPCAFIENVLRRCQPATDVYEQHMEVISVYMENFIRAISDVYYNITSMIECQTCSQRQAQYVCNKGMFGSSHNLTFDKDKSDVKKNILPKLTEMMGRRLTRSDSIMKPKITEKIQEDKAGTSKDPDVVAKVEEIRPKPGPELKGPEAVPMIAPETIFKADTEIAVPTIVPTAAPTIVPTAAPTIVPTAASTVPEAIPNTSRAQEPVSESVSENISQSGSCTRCLQEGKLCMKHCPKLKK